MKYYVIVRHRLGGDAQSLPGVETLEAASRIAIAFIHADFHTSVNYGATCISGDQEVSQALFEQEFARSR